MIILHYSKIKVVNEPSNRSYATVYSAYDIQRRSMCVVSLSTTICLPENIRIGVSHANRSEEFSLNGPFFIQMEHFLWVDIHSIIIPKLPLIVL